MQSMWHAGKWKAVVTEIKRMNKTGRPVLVGTTSVEKSETLAARLKEAGIACQVCPYFFLLLCPRYVPTSSYGCTPRMSGVSLLLPITFAPCIDLFCQMLRDLKSAKAMPRVHHL